MVNAELFKAFLALGLRVSDFGLNVLGLGMWSLRIRLGLVPTLTGWVGGLRCRV